MIRSAAAAALALALTSPAAGQELRPAERALVDQADAALAQGCEPNARSALAFTAGEPALAAAGLVSIAQPPEYQRDSLSVGPGTPSYAVPSATGIEGSGRVLLASAPGAHICQALITDGPTRFWVYTRLEPRLAARGWRVAEFKDGSDVERRLYRHRGPAGDDATLRLVEYQYGDGPAQRVRLRATVQWFPPAR